MVGTDGEARVDVEAEDTPPDSKPKTTRERSTIEFPYGDLETGIAVARAIYQNAGLNCATDQLAGYMRQTVTSGAFRQSVATARIFGLVETERGSVALTDLGQRIVDPSQERASRADAFLAVPLYRAIYDLHRGHPLPPASALEREMRELGVAAKQTDRARQAFDRSADQAGFYGQGRDRLVMPAARSDEPPADHDEGDAGGGAGGGDGGDAGGRQTVKLTSGGEIEMRVSVNPFSLSREDREFVFGLIDKLTEYQKKAEPNALPAPAATEARPEAAAGGAVLSEE